MSWVTKTKAGSWRAGYRGPDGRIHSKNFKLKEEAKGWLRGEESSADRGAWVDPSLGRKTTLAAFWPKFLEARRNLRPSSLEFYRRHAERYILSAPLGNHPLGSIRPLDVEAWLGDVANRANPPTVHAAFRTLRAILSAAEDAEIISRNPARKVRAPKVPKHEMRPLTTDELAAVLRELPSRYRALVLLLGLCGPRIGEAIALQVSDVDLLRRRVKLTKAATEVRGKVALGPTKTEKARSVNLPRVVANAISEHLAAFPPSADGLLFPSEEGGLIRRTNFRRRVWLPAVHAAGIADPLPRVHDLRHTAASLAIAEGAHPKAIQEMLGHSSIVVTLDIYGHLFEGLGEQLAERLDERFREASGDA